MPFPKEGIGERLILTTMRAPGGPPPQLMQDCPSLENHTVFTKQLISKKFSKSSAAVIPFQARFRQGLMRAAKKPLKKGETTMKHKLLTLIASMVAAAALAPAPVAAQN